MNFHNITALPAQYGRIDGHAKYAREQQAIENGEVTIGTEEGELFSQPEEDEKKVARRKKSVYNEFMTIAMQWAYNDSVQPGETKTIYDGRRKRYITIEKTINNSFEEVTIEKMEDDT